MILYKCTYAYDIDYAKRKLFGISVVFFEDGFNA